MRFVGQPAGIERKHFDPRRMLRDQVQQDHVFEAEAAGKGAGLVLGFDLFQ